MTSSTKVRLLAGVAVIFPIVITIIVFRFLIVKLNSWILSPIVNFIRPFIDRPYEVIAAQLLVFLLLLVGIYLIGWAANVLVIRRFFSAWEGLLIRVPMIGKIYKALKQITGAVFGQEKSIFKAVVLVEFPQKGHYTIGFVTNENNYKVTKLLGKEMVNILVPSVPNPATGFLLMIPKSEVRYLNISIEEGIKIAVSGGVYMPETSEKVV